MSNLVDHARRELEILGEDDWTTDGIITIIQAFADVGHSGGSAMVCIPRIVKLLQFENLTPLTNDPDEWLNVNQALTGQWQNKRNPQAFSRDGGKTYYLLPDVDTFYVSKEINNGLD